MAAFEPLNDVLDGLFDFIKDNEQGLEDIGRGDIVDLLYKAEDILVKAHTEMSKEGYF